MITINQLVKGMRAQLGWSKAELSRRCGAITETGERITTDYYNSVNPAGGETYDFVVEGTRIVSADYIRAIEDKGADPDFSKVIALAYGFNIALDDFVRDLSDIQGKTNLRRLGTVVGDKRVELIIER